MYTIVIYGGNTGCTLSLPLEVKQLAHYRYLWRQNRPYAFVSYGDETGCTQLLPKGVKPK
jgi:hypothetical protein